MGTSQWEQVNGNKVFFLVEKALQRDGDVTETRSPEPVMCKKKNHGEKVRGEQVSPDSNLQVKFRITANRRTKYNP